jgi:dTDP-4-amino-4,6-dideoxygalactose transaminase
MDRLLSIAAAHGLFLIEDAAQAFGASYQGRPLGTQGHIGCYSFHSTKNIIAGEGGAFVTHDDQVGRRAEIIREKGTNRTQFLRGQAERYVWVDIGSSFVISDLLVALLYAQFQRLEEITCARRKIWWRYYEQMAPMEADGLVIRPGLDPQAEHNGHIYAFRVSGSPQHLRQQRDLLLTYLNQHGIEATFHFVPLHSSPYGQQHLNYKEDDLPITERVSASLIRLPLYPELTLEQIDYIMNVLDEGLRHVA